MTKARVSPRKVTDFVQILRAARLKKEAIKQLRLKTRQLNRAKLAQQEVVLPLNKSTISTVIQLGFQLVDRRKEMSDSFHPADDDPPPVYTAQAFQNCLDVGDSWKQVAFLDKLNNKSADEFFDVICNMNAFVAGEGFWWQDLDDKRYLSERRQCIAFNLRRFESVESSDKDYLSAMADSFEDARQLWRNKTRHMNPGQLEEFRLNTVTPSDRKKARAMAMAIRNRIAEMELNPERLYADNFVNVLNLSRADLVNTYGSVWIAKSEFSRDLMGSSRFVLSGTTVAPNATQSDEQREVGSIAIPSSMVTWLQMTYGMTEDFLMARTPSWIGWMNQQRLHGRSPTDAMLVDTFIPALNEVLPPHLVDPVMIPVINDPPVVRTHDDSYGTPVAGGSGQNMEVDLDAVGSISLDLMDQEEPEGQEHNEAILIDDIKEEDLQVELVGEPHEERPDGHGLCVDADQGRMIVSTLKGAIPYETLCTEFCLLSGSGAPFESYVYPKKDIYAIRRCELVDQSVSLTKGTLYPLLSNLSALQSYDQYHHVLPLSILGRGSNSLCCKSMDTSKQWMHRQKFCEDVRSTGYMTLFNVPYNDRAWRRDSEQYLKVNPDRSIDRNESCTLICAMNPMGRLLIIQTLIMDKGLGTRRIGFDLPDQLAGLLMDKKIAKISWDKDLMIRLCLNAGMPLAPVNVVDANLMTFLAFPQFEINNWVSKRLRTDESFAAQKMGMSLVYHTARHVRLSPDSSRVNEILWDCSSSTENQAAWNPDSLRYLRWKGVVGLMLVEAMASRSLALTGAQPKADVIRVVHLILDRLSGFTWTPLIGNRDLSARRPFLNWMENNRVLIDKVEYAMKPYLIMYNDSVHSSWLNSAKYVINRHLNRPRRYSLDEGCLHDMCRTTPGYDFAPAEGFDNIDAMVVWKKILETESMFAPHPCVRCSEFNHDVQICPRLPEDVVCLYCRADGHNMQVCPQLNSYCVGCEIPGHAIHYHDLPLNIYESLNNFRVMKKFGYQSCRFITGNNVTIRVVKDEDSGAWKMKWTTRLEVLNFLGAAPGNAPGLPFTSSK